jgi:hypothetical protein
MINEQLLAAVIRTGLRTEIRTCFVPNTTQDCLQLYRIVRLKDCNGIRLFAVFLKSFRVDYG